MEDLKEKIPMVMTAIIAIIICGVTFYFLENYEAVYYTKVDNSKIVKVSSSDEMKYEYTLNSYDENGNKKEIKFKTARELRNSAFLMLEVKTFGVHSWKEVQINELPEKVKTALNVKQE